MIAIHFGSYRVKVAFGRTRVQAYKGDAARAVTASRQLTRLNPTSVAAHFQLGSALAAANKRNAARRALRRAIDLDPAQIPAVESYFNLVLDAGEPTRARKMLERVAAHTAPCNRAYLEIRVALGERRYPDTDAPARQLFLDPSAPQVLVDAALTRLLETRGLVMKNVLEDLSREPNAPARVGPLWARAACASGMTPSAPAIGRLRARNPEMAAGALATVFDCLGDRQGVLRTLWLALAHFRFVRDRTQLWGKVGYVFAAADWNLLGLLWHRGHEARSVPPWMLFNLAASMRALGLGGRAAALSRRALTLPRDDSHAGHAAFVALDAVLRGKVDEAEARLRDAGPRRTPHFEVVWQLASSLVTLARASGTRKLDAARVASSHLDALAPNRWMGIVRTNGRFWRRVARHIGLSAGALDFFVAGWWDTALACAAVLVPIYFVTTGVYAWLWPVVMALVAVKVIRVGNWLGQRPRRGIQD